MTLRTVRVSAVPVTSVRMTYMSVRSVGVSSRAAATVSAKTAERHSDKANRTKCEGRDI